MRSPRSRLLRRRSRGRILVEALVAIRLLREDRWSVAELAAEMGRGLRSIYRMLAYIEAAGIRLSRWPVRERGGGMRYSISGAELRRALLVAL